ncbi:MAG: hypothetical protein GF334_04290 [Candidatus Altiarchaeales archaeon]|nr:hypothetical protein [Candidatus Altiarchaeales archaeon]
MSTLDPLQIINMIRYAADEDTKRDYGVDACLISAFREICEYATACNYQIKLIAEFIQEQKRNAYTPQNFRTECLQEYYDMLYKIFSGPLEEMPPLITEKLPFIQACATWRLRKGR